MPKIDEYHIILMQALITDTAIKSNLLAGLGDVEAWKIMDINEDGSITLGKTRCRWWNRLLGDEKTVSFGDFASVVMKHLIGLANRDKSDIVLEALSKEYVTNGVINNDYPAVIDRLFDCARFGVDGPLKSKGFKARNHQLEIDVDRQIQSSNGIHRVYLPGSGQPLMDIEIGIVGTRDLRK